MAPGEAEEQATALFNALYGEAQDLTQGIEESKPNIWDTDTSKLPNEAVKLMGKDNITQAATDYSKLNDDESTLFIDKFIKLLETIKPLGQNQQFTGANARALILNSIYVYSYKLYRAIALRLIEKQTNTNRMDAGYIASGSGAGNEGEDTHCSTSVLKSILSQAEEFPNLTRHVLSAQKVIPEIQQLISNKHPSLLREVILCPFPTEEIKRWSQMRIALMTVGLQAHINAINKIIHDNKQLLTDMHKAETEVAAEAEARGAAEDGKPAGAGAETGDEKPARAEAETGDEKPARAEAETGAGIVKHPKSWAVPILTFLIFSLVKPSPYSSAIVALICSGAAIRLTTKGAAEDAGTAAGSPVAKDSSASASAPAAEDSRADAGLGAAAGSSEIDYYKECQKMAGTSSDLSKFITEHKMQNKELDSDNTLEFYQHCIQAITPSSIDLRKNKYHKTCPLTALICTGIFDGLLATTDKLSEAELNEFKENTKQYLNRQSKHTTSNAEHSSFKSVRSFFSHTYLSGSHTQDLRNKVLSTLLKKLQDYPTPSSTPPQARKP
jgi:hypothetical protein